jgi:hypothetical protein
MIGGRFPMPQKKNNDTNLEIKKLGHEKDPK